MSRERENNGATVRCFVCGLEVTGALVDGRLMPSDRVRPRPGARVLDGLCMKHAESDGGWAGPWPEDEQENTGAEA